MLSDRNREYTNKLSGGIGLGWIAIAIVWAAIIFNPTEIQIDCFVGVEVACATIAESYTNE